MCSKHNYKKKKCMQHLLLLYMYILKKKRSEQPRKQYMELVDPNQRASVFLTSSAVFRSTAPCGFTGRGGGEHGDFRQVILHHVDKMSNRTFVLVTEKRNSSVLEQNSIPRFH